MYSIHLSSSLHEKRFQVWSAVFPAKKRPLKAGKLTLTASRGLRPLEAIKLLIVRPLKVVFWPENRWSHLKSFSIQVKWQMNEVKYYSLVPSSMCLSNFFELPFLPSRKKLRYSFPFSTIILLHPTVMYSKKGWWRLWMRAFGNETFILVFLFSSLRVLEGLEVEFRINYTERSNAKM